MISSKLQTLLLPSQHDSGPTVVELDPKTRDFYNANDEFAVFDSARKKAKSAREDLTPEE